MILKLTLVSGRPLKSVIPGQVKATKWKNQIKGFQRFCVLVDFPIFSAFKIRKIKKEFYTSNEILAIG